MRISVTRPILGEEIDLGSPAFDDFIAATGTSFREFPKASFKQ
jgi:hypothetical protein